MQNSLATLPDHARVWIFQADRFLTESEVDTISNVLNSFIPQWAAHGNQLYGGYTVEKNLFIVIGVDESQSPASGCSIDSLTKVIKELGADLKIDFFNRLAISYEDDNGGLQLVSMEKFKELVKANEVNKETIVFNNLVADKGEFDRKWRSEVKNSWHTNLFELV